MRSYLYRLQKPLFICSLLLSASTMAQAHDPGLSAADVIVSANGPVIHLTFATNDIERLCDIDTDRNRIVSSEEFTTAKTELEALARRAFELQLDEQSLTATDVTLFQDKKSEAVRFELTFSRARGSYLHLRSAILNVLPRGHKQYLSVRNELGTVLAERILETGNEQLLVDLGNALSSHSSRSFIVLGIEHIVTGFDHLAFLLALLLAGSGLREAGKLITSFTLAHSITLALATFDLVRIPASVVEPLIAASIIYVGVENLIRQEMKRRWLLTFGFGLVHGLGFASVLRDLGIADGGLRAAITPLLSFNLGVEIGQITIAALILPLIWRLRQHSAFVLRYVPAGSLIIAILGSYWLIDRTLLK